MSLCSRLMRLGDLLDQVCHVPSHQAPSLLLLYALQSQAIGKNYSTVAFELVVLCGMWSQLL